LLYRSRGRSQQRAMNDNFRELLGVVATVVLAVFFVEITSMLFLAFTGISTGIWIFAVPSRNVDQRSTSQRGSTQSHLQGVGVMYSEGSQTICAREPAQK
jgi:hypothetical protein